MDAILIYFVLVFVIAEGDEAVDKEIFTQDWRQPNFKHTLKSKSSVKAGISLFEDAASRLGINVDKALEYNLEHMWLASVDRSQLLKHNSGNLTFASGK